ncbi:PKD domain-containing protein [bacterium]|nr:PKD domain-containing protein [bacterium]
MGRGTTAALLFGLSLIAAVSLTGCGGDGSSLTDAALEQAEPVADRTKTEIPAPNELKVPSGIESGVCRLGSHYQSNWPYLGVVREYNEQVSIRPHYDDNWDLDYPGFAIYAFDLNGQVHDGLLRLDVYRYSHNSVLREKVWIGLADYWRNCWDWYQCSPDWTVPTDPDRHYFNGSLKVAVVCMSTLQLNSIRLVEELPPRLYNVYPRICVSGEDVVFEGNYYVKRWNREYGEPVDWEWQVGNDHWQATSTEVQPSFSFPAAGEYIIEVTAGNAAGLYRYTSNLVVEAPGPYRPGHLYAVPVKTDVAVDEPVTIEFITGSLPPDRPFHYLNGIGLLTSAGAEYVGNTLNVGRIGGDPTELDGIWIAQDPLPVAFFTSEGLISPHLTEVPGLVRFDLAVVPIGGQQTFQDGVICNLQLAFTQPGEYRLSFQEREVVSRTYYSDSDSSEHFWYDISNDGVPNTITVTE